MACSVEQLAEAPDLLLQKLRGGAAGLLGSRQQMQEQQQAEEERRSSPRQPMAATNVPRASERSASGCADPSIGLQLHSQQQEQPLEPARRSIRASGRSGGATRRSASPSQPRLVGGSSSGGGASSSGLSYWQQDLPSYAAGPSVAAGAAGSPLWLLAEEGEDNGSIERLFGGHSGHRHRRAAAAASLPRSPAAAASPASWQPPPPQQQQQELLAGSLYADAGGANASDSLDTLLMAEGGYLGSLLLAAKRRREPPLALPWSRQHVSGEQPQQMGAAGSAGW